MAVGKEEAGVLVGKELDAGCPEQNPLLSTFGDLKRRTMYEEGSALCLA